MYERFYHLRERPFALSPDPEYLYRSRVHQEALDYLRYGLESHAGFVVVTGEIGSGKTTLLQSVLRTLDPHTTVARIVNTILDPRELLESLMVDLGLDPAGRSKPLLLRDLAQFLVDQRMQGRLVLVVIDEAQNLSAAALEELRMLSNLETEKSKLLQIVLVGQPDMRNTLNSPALEQLRQRITVSYHLGRLDADDTHNYINHRLARAALGAPMQFPREVSDLVHERSRGVPRVINVICDAVLVFGYAEERRQVDRGLATDAIKELEATAVLPKVADAEGALPPPATAAIALTSSAGAPVLAADPSGATPPEEPRLESAGASAAPLPGRPAPAMAPRAVDSLLAAREAEIRRREEQLADRERELQEQRRVLSEEYRLMRGSPHRAFDAAAAGSGPPATKIAGAPYAGRNIDRSRAAERPAPNQIGTTGRATRPAPPYVMPRREGFWHRMRRLIFGMPEPATSDRT